MTCNILQVRDWRKLQSSGIQNFFQKKWKKCINGDLLYFSTSLSTSSTLPFLFSKNLPCLAFALQSYLYLFQCAASMDFLVILMKSRSLVTRFFWFLLEHPKDLFWDSIYFPYMSQMSLSAFTLASITCTQMILRFTTLLT